MSEIESSEFLTEDLTEDKKEEPHMHSSCSFYTYTPFLPPLLLEARCHLLR